MENFSELIKNRRSMRKFTDEQLTKGYICRVKNEDFMKSFS